MDRLIGLVGRVFANGPVDLGSIPGRVIPKTLKMVLDTSLLNTQQYKVCIKGKVEKSRERSSALPDTSVYSLLKRETSGRPRLRSPTLLTYYRILRKKQNGFRRNRSTTSQILTIRRIVEGVRAKNLQATLIFVDFTKAFDSIHRGKMEQILLAYGIPKETVAAITILHRNTKVKWRHRILRHCSRSTTRGHAGPVPLYHLSRLRA